MKVRVAEAKRRLPELIKKVESGEPVTICRRDMPVVDLVLTQHVSKRPHLGTFCGRITINEPDWWKPLTDKEVDDFLDGRYVSLP